MSFEFEYLSGRSYLNEGHNCSFKQHEMAGNYLGTQEVVTISG